MPKMTRAEAERIVTKVMYGAPGSNYDTPEGSMFPGMTNEVIGALLMGSAPARYTIRIINHIAPAHTLTIGEWADVVNHNTAKYPEYAARRVMKFENAAAAHEAGNVYCDAAPSHPVFGAPGFEVVG